MGAHEDARWLADESARLFTGAGDDIGVALAQQTLAFIDVRTGQMYLVEAGVAHAVLPGSHGTLVIIDV